MATESKHQLTIVDGIDISSVPIIGSWTKDVGYSRLNLDIPKDDDGFIGGIQGVLSTSTHKPDYGRMRIDWLAIEDRNFLGHGLGKRILQSFGAEVKEAGANTLVGYIRSEAGIHNRLQTFGEDNVTFFEEVPVGDSGKREVIGLPLTREQAIESLHRAQESDEDATIGAMTDLMRADTSGWQLPTLESSLSRPNLAVISQVMGDLALT